MKILSQSKQPRPGTTSARLQQPEPTKRSTLLLQIQSRDPETITRSAFKDSCSFKPWLQVLTIDRIDDHGVRLVFEKKTQSIPIKINYLRQLWSEAHDARILHKIHSSIGQTPLRNFNFNKFKRFSQKFNFPAEREKLKTFFPPSHFDIDDEILISTREKFKIYDFTCSEKFNNSRAEDASHLMA